MRFRSFRPFPSKIKMNILTNKIYLLQRVSKGSKNHDFINVFVVNWKTTVGKTTREHSKYMKSNLILMDL